MMSATGIWAELMCHRSLLRWAIPWLGCRIQYGLDEMCILPRRGSEGIILWCQLGTVLWPIPARCYSSGNRPLRLKLHLRHYCSQNDSGCLVVLMRMKPKRHCALSRANENHAFIAPMVRFSASLCDEPCFVDSTILYSLPVIQNNPYSSHQIGSSTTKSGPVPSVLLQHFGASR
jgi:hypothetical protein